MYFNFDDRYIRLDLHHCLMQLFPNDHACACTDDAYAPGIKTLYDLLKHLNESIMSPENETGFIERCCDNSHTILFKKAGMLETAAWRAVQYNNIGVKVS